MRFISCYKLEPCQNEGCDIRATGLWKTKDGRLICSSCKDKEFGFWADDMATVKGRE